MITLITHEFGCLVANNQGISNGGMPYIFGLDRDDVPRHLYWILSRNQNRNSISLKILHTRYINENGLVPKSIKSFCQRQILSRLSCVACQQLRQKIWYLGDKTFWKSSNSFDPFAPLGMPAKQWSSLACVVCTGLPWRKFSYFCFPSTWSSFCQRAFMVTIPRVQHRLYVFWICMTLLLAFKNASAFLLPRNLSFPLPLLADGVRIKVSSVSKLVLVLNFSPELSLFAKLLRIRFHSFTALFKLFHWKCSWLKRMPEDFGLHVKMKRVMWLNIWLVFGFVEQLHVLKHEWFQRRHYHLVRVGVILSNVL